MMALQMSHSATVIAIVDDEEPVRKALGRLLRAAGFDPRAFASGRDFLDSLGLQLPDCAIVDLHLPGLSGLEVQNQLSQANIHLPCIIITGKDEPGTSDAVKAAGAAAYLSKPLDEQVLLGAISSAMPQ